MIRKELIKEREDPEFWEELTDKDLDQFLDFAACMMRWLPENRKTAAELLQHPFLFHED